VDKVEEQVDGGRFAGSVCAQQAVNIAGVDLQVQTFQGIMIAKGFFQVGGF
jgi:hypothetical protein